jgi:predicted Zn finger-like uncharacterized protein
MEQQLVIDPKDLTLCIECPKCHSQFAVKIHEARPAVPDKCSNCDTVWWPPTGPLNPVPTFITWFKNLSETKGPKITFRIPWPATEAPKGQEQTAEVPKGQ